MIENPAEEKKSKTRVKNEMHALQSLGEELLGIPVNVYKSFPIPDELGQAIADARKINSNSAMRRQLQLIGKLMRRIDSEPIQLALDEWKNGQKKRARDLQNIEKLREQLLDGDIDVLNDLIGSHPGCDIQQLRQLIRLAQQERKLEKPPKHFRKLFQFLKEL